MTPEETERPARLDLARGVMSVAGQKVTATEISSSLPNRPAAA